jgi:spore maturation protein CgeB
VIVGSFVPEGRDVGEWAIQTADGVVAFYDIDTPVTLSMLHRNECPYASAELIPKYDLYLSFAGGTALSILEGVYRARKARPLYCSVDPAVYYPEPTFRPRWDLGYLGTYSDDRQPALERMLLAPARLWPGGRFVVAGPQYPDVISWPTNTERIEHIAPSEHRRFYSSQRFTLNVPRAEMVRLGCAPSVRLFEAAASGVPIISDWWQGIETFFSPGEEILISHTPLQTMHFLKDIPDDKRNSIAARALERVLKNHTAKHRAKELIELLSESIAS